MGKKCSVESCSQITRKDGFHAGGFDLCVKHRWRWHDFFAGYQDGHYGNSDRHGRLNKKLWDKAMLAFLEHCRVEIAACTQIAEAVLRVKGVKGLSK